MADSKSSVNIGTITLRLGFWAAILATVEVIISGITAKMFSGNSSLISGFTLIPLMTALLAVIHDYAPRAKNLQPDRATFYRRLRRPD